MGQGLQASPQVSHKRTKFPSVDTGGRCLEQQEIADLLGISRARVSAIERQALSKLLRLAEAEGLTFDSHSPGNLTVDNRDTFRSLLEPS